MISIEKSETNKKKEHWKSETNLSQTMANALEIRDKFVSDFHCSDRFKGFFNLSWTMKFVPDFYQCQLYFMVRDKFKNPLNLTDNLTDNFLP